MKHLMIYILIAFANVLIAKNISGVYLTHKGTEGGQSIVEIFEYNGKYFIYGMKNLEANPIEDSCNKNKELQKRKSVGNVFAYGYEEDSKGNFVNGLIYNFYNCKTYHGKIIPKDNDTISFIGAIDSYYIISLSYEWKQLTPNEIKEYERYRIPIQDLIPTIHDTMRSRK